MDKEGNISRLAEKIASSSAKKVLLQLPEGLKFNSGEILDGLGKYGIDAVVSGGATYGACDIRDAEARQLGCDLVVHVGHSKFYRDFSTEVPVIYFPWDMGADFSGIDVSQIKEKRIGLLTNIQHIAMLDSVKTLMESAGKEAVVGGQILGCWCANANRIGSDVDAFLFAGSGDFHSLALQTEKPVYVLNAEKRIVERLDSSGFEKKRYANIFRARDARTFAVLVSMKKGQNNLTADADKVVEYLKGRNKKAFIVVMDYITDEDLRGLKVDAFINTACPRLADDMWSKPFINAGDIDKIFE